MQSLLPPVRGGVLIKCSCFVSKSFRSRGGDISGQIPGQCPQDLNVERGRVYDGDVDADPDYIFLTYWSQMTGLATADHHLFII